MRTLPRHQAPSDIFVRLVLEAEAKAKANKASYSRKLHMLCFKFSQRGRKVNS